jgi:hypothetical protein
MPEVLVRAVTKSTRAKIQKTIVPAAGLKDTGSLVEGERSILTSAL